MEPTTPLPTSPLGTIFPSRPRKFSREDIDRIKEETERWYLSHPLGPIPRLTWLLFSLLIGTGIKWFIMFLQLSFHVFLLLPAFFFMGIRYMNTSQVLHNRPYGPNSRNFLDIYLPDIEKHPPPKGGYPVVVFISGGAWIIGYKAWSAMVALSLCDAGIVCITPDYRNYPQGTIADMLTDSSHAMSWVYDNCNIFGWNQDRVFLCGQSAGAHISFLTVLDQIMMSVPLTEVESDERTNLHREGVATWPVERLAGYVGVSGPYDIVTYGKVLHRRGLHSSIMRRIMCGRSLVDYHSPTRRVQRATFAKAAPQFPRSYFFHGSADKTCPPESTSGIVSALRMWGVEAGMTIYAGKTHTDNILEDLFNTVGLGRSGDLITDIYEIVQGTATIHADGSIRTTLDRSIINKVAYEPRFLIDFARWANPF